MYRKMITQTTWFIIVVLVCGTSLNAQIRITEILANSVEEPSYEWIEIENTSGTPLSLSGFVFDDNDDNALSAANIVADMEIKNTTIPANGVAVLSTLR